MKLLDRADVLVQNLAPGAAARLGLSYAGLQEIEGFSRLSAEQVIERLDAAQIANARMNDVHEAWELDALIRWHVDREPIGWPPCSCWRP